MIYGYFIFNKFIVALFLYENVVDIFISPSFNKFKKLSSEQIFLLIHLFRRESAIIFCYLIFILRSPLIV